MPCLLHQVEVAGLHRFPHLSGPAGSMKHLTPEEVKPQLLVRHHPQVAFTHHGEDRHGGDSVRGKVLEFDPIVLEKRPCEAA